MIRHLLLMTLLTLSAPVVLSAADTLSVVPMAEALQNSDLDADDDLAAPARQAVQDLLWNAPAEALERERFHRRLAQLARHRDTRVGKLFFAALEATPGIVNLPDGLTRATVVTRWPLALDTSLQVRVEFARRHGEWKIDAIETTVDGIAGAPISGLAPYFGEGEGDPEKLDFQPVDYLVGRNPADRQLPESERAEFDFDAALQRIFDTEPGAVGDVLDKLAREVTPENTRESRIEALEPHLATDDEVRALREADADDDRRVHFWREIYEQIKDARRAPRPDAMPRRNGARISVEYTVINEEAHTQAAMAAVRLQSGRISPREGLPAAND